MKTTNISKTKPNKTKLKPGSGRLLRHLARKWIRPILQLLGTARGYLYWYIVIL